MECIVSSSCQQPESFLSDFSSQVYSLRSEDASSQLTQEGSSEMVLCTHFG